MPTERLTKHVWRHEVACNCGCGFDAADIELVEQLEECITHFEQTLSVAKLNAVFNSWCRCFVHNREVGGASDSQHPLGRAVDFYIIGVPPDDVADYLERRYPGSHGIGRYNSFTHFDRRPKAARWDHRTREA
jgi:uncharacterized protein YcbK (DUF882 family)